MSTIAQNGDLFSRCLQRYLFFLCAGLINLYTISVSAQEENTLLNTLLATERPYSGDSDSLLDIIQQHTNCTIAYSNRIYQRRSVRMSKQKATIRQYLDAIFSRFNVKYSVNEEKIIVWSEQVGYVNIRGFCTDRLTGEALVGASIVDSTLMRGLSTNGEGYFYLRLPAGHITLQATFVGYNTFRKKMTCAPGDTTINISLSPRSTMTTTVDIHGSGGFISSDERTGNTDLPMEQIKAMPTLFGESDVIRTLQQTPGTSSGNEGFGGMSVRGGSTDQNMVYIDNVPIYSPNHMLGMFSSFNTDIVSHISLLKSGFPARYGGKLSSVLDIKTRNGNKHRLHGSINSGLMATTGVVEGPIIPQRLSFIVSARRSYFEPVMKLAQRKQDATYTYYFYDVTTKVNWQPTERNSFSAFFMCGYDKLSNKNNYTTQSVVNNGSRQQTVEYVDKKILKWGNIISSLRWDHTFSSQITSNTTTWMSKYDFTNRQQETEQRDKNTKNEYSNGIYEYGLRTDFNFYPNNVSAVLHAGTWVNRKEYIPYTYIYTDDIVRSDTTINGEIKKQSSQSNTELHVYAEAEMRCGKIYSTIGAHLSTLFRSNREAYVRLEPRLLFGYRASKFLSIKAGYSMSSQITYLARSTTTSLPSDIWMPVPDNQSPQFCSQISLGTLWSIAPNVKFSVEAYHKWYPNLLTYVSTPYYAMSDISNWANTCTAGKGYSKGIEFFVHKTNGKISGWIGYSLSESANEFSAINGGKSFPSDFDCLHSTNIFVTYAISDKTDISASWSYNSGTPLTLPTEKYYIRGNDNALPIPPERNTMRMPQSHQLNVGVDIKRNSKRMGSVLSFGIYNLYGRANPTFVYWKADEQTQQYKLKKFSLIALPIPYVKYTIRF